MILTINSGSSSIKFALFKPGFTPELLLAGGLENIGTNKALFHFNITATPQKYSVDIEAGNHDQAVKYLVDWLEKLDGFDSVTAIGHRVVHGMKHTGPELITDDLLVELKKGCVFDPDHLPEEINLIEVFQDHYPAIKQIACFDTSFHTSMPAVAKLLSIPRRYHAEGIQRYGFHGLSYTFLMQELKKIAGKETIKGRVILAHLGNGASLAAVKDGKSIDTSMGFTPTSGLMMGTRTGDLDPGVGLYLMQSQNLSPKEFNHLVNQESGLLGISETSADMRDLVKREYSDSRAAEAIELFCYQTKKWIGSFAAALGGLDVLVFSGGIGDHSPEVRSKICDGLEFLGIELDEIKNMNNEPMISTETSKVQVRVIKTNEELVIAKMVCDVLHYPIENAPSISGEIEDIRCE
jgi:acetate kinase